MPRRTQPAPAPSALQDVVIELAARPSPGSVETRRSAFDALAEPVEREVVRAGGEVLGRAWINHTIRARVPAAACAALEKLGEVERVSAPRRLAADAVTR